jgi:hypothetical protein
MFSMIPKEAAFFELFERAANNVHQGAVQLVEFLEKFDDGAERAKQIKELEHAGDQLTHQTILLLNKTFITPFDREDIHELACRLDDILDLTDTAANRIVLYRIAAPTEDARKLARCLQRATAIIVEALGLLRDAKHTEAILQKCIAIHTQENEADQTLQHALAALFENGLDPREIIKWKDIYQEIETATDRCEDVANVLEAIGLKNA